MAIADAKPFASVAYPLNEASGAALDAVGSLDATEVNTVGTGTVFGGAARDFEATENDKFTHADDNAFDTGNIKWMITAMCRLESKDQSYGAVAGKVSNGGDPEWHLIFRASADTFEFVYGGATVRSTDFGTVSTATDYLIHAGHDPDTDEIFIAVNGVKTTLSHSTGATASTRGFAIGDMGEYHDGDSGWDGLIREVVILQGYVFSDAEIAEHLNSGSPIPFADWDAGGGGAFKSAWARNSNVLIQPLVSA